MDKNVRIFKFILTSCVLSSAYNIGAHHKLVGKRVYCSRPNSPDAPISDVLYLSPDISKWRIISRIAIEASENTIELKSDQFATIFQQCAPYIAMHRGTKVVIHIPSYVMGDRDVFDAVMDDVAILHLLGVQLVLIPSLKSHEDICDHMNGMRVTDDQGLKVLQERSGSARSSIESSLARGFRGRPGQSGINVVSGNFFYSAKPIGVRDGTDFKLSGEVRRIEVENLSKRLDSGDVVLLTSLGYSSSGETFNVPSESLAADCAAQLGASKVIFLTRGQGIVDDSLGEAKRVENLRLTQAVALLEHFQVSPATYNQEVDVRVPGDGGVEEAELRGDVVRLVARCVHALSGGTRRAHLIPARKGALLQELYTPDGYIVGGTLISKDVYDGIRPAQASDLRAIEEIIAPLVQQGVLVHRSRDQLEKDLPDCHVVTRDGSVVALGMLKLFGVTHAEVCCLAVHPSYRRSGRGETLLAYLERRAILLGVKTVFVLSTRTMQWFEERGFALASEEKLPATRMYDKSRGSKIYIKELRSLRDVDVEEDLWNV